MIVRRGAVHRFESLKKKTAHLQVEVMWDQRSDEPPAPDPATGERRRKPPFTWDVADFVVATRPASNRKTRKEK